MGRLSEKKGLDLALKAFQDVARKRADAFFLIAGGDEDDTGLNARRLANDLELDGRVRFLGEIKGDVRREALADADLFILTSHSENFGMAAAEAMAAGVPVLLSDKVGICRSAVAAGAGAVTSLEVPEIARTWLRLLNNPQDLHRMGERGAAFVRREYEPDIVAHRMIQMYREIVGQASARPN
jgi:glycosyltransferase involved in cell wall biosynthesis